MTRGHTLGQVGSSVQAGGQGDSGAAMGPETKVGQCEQQTMGQSGEGESHVWGHRATPPPTWSSWLPPPCSCLSLLSFVFLLLPLSLRLLSLSAAAVSLSSFSLSAPLCISRLHCLPICTPTSLP